MTSLRWNRVKGNRKDLMDDIRDLCTELSDNEIPRIHRKRRRFVGTIQENYDGAKEEALRHIDEWADELPLI